MNEDGYWEPLKVIGILLLIALVGFAGYWGLYFLVKLIHHFWNITG